MAKKGAQFERKYAAFNRACKFKSADEVISIGEWLIKNFSDDQSKDVKFNVFSNVGYALTLKKRYDEALSYMTEAVGLNAHDPIVYNMRALCFIAQGKMDDALKNVSEAIKLDPYLAEAYMNKGVINASEGKFNEALSDLNRAIDINPNDANYYSNRGNVLSELERFGEAVKDFDTAIELDPLLTEAFHNRATTIGKLEAIETRRKYEQELKSVTNPKEIEERFQSRKDETTIRLHETRLEADRVSKLLVKSIPTTWTVLAVVLNWQYIFPKSGLDFLNDHPWYAPLILTSVTLATLFLNFPLLARLSYLNRNARIERHVLEDYDRKSVMLLIRNLEGENVNTVLEHFKDNGTPEVLNKLYHPKQAYKETNDAISKSLLERIETLLKQIIGKDSS